MTELEPTSIQAIASVASIILLFISLFITVKAHTQSSKYEAIKQGSAILANAESRIGENPELLRFHGINIEEDELKAHGLSATDLAYLLNNFSAGGVFYRCLPSKEKNVVLSEGSYRYEMMKSEHTQRAWPLLRRLLTNSDYRKRLDELHQELSSSRLL